MDEPDDYLEFNVLDNIRWSLEKQYGEMREESRDNFGDSMVLATPEGFRLRITATLEPMGDDDGEEEEG